MICNRNIFAKPWPLDCEEWIAFGVCGNFLILHFYPQVVLLSNKQISLKILLKLVEKQNKDMFCQN